ncbi:MAG TPA: ATP-binding cassette domain-containing protein, partial [Rhodoblastus sp.]|nr:ATP-binding cassette domain-containing protein [Rhodoblastus sp.]
MSSGAGGAPLLEVRDVAVRFDGIVALDGVSFKLQKGQVLGLIGPNGAGKTTMFNCLSRLYTPTEGDVLFEGQSILPRPAHEMAAIGIGRTFQNVALFSRLTVRENVLIGGHSHTTSNFFNDSLRLP